MRYLFGDSAEVKLGEDLIVAAKVGAIADLIILLHQGADINYLDQEEKKSAIYHAFKNNHNDIVDELLKRGADVSVFISKKVRNALNNSNKVEIRDFSSDEFIELMLGIMKNNSITSLDLSSNNIGIKGAEYIANAVTKNSSITSLNLSSNDIGSKGVEYVANAMMKNSSITSLDLSSNNIGIKGAEYVANAIMKNNSIISLNLSWNKIVARGAGYIANAMMKNSSITSLYLSDNTIGYYGAEHIANAIMKNNSITSLDLSLNEIGDKGADYIANAIMKNNSIASLSLIGCEIGGGGARSIANAIMQNNSIAYLNLGGNKIGDEGVEYVANAIINNNSITSLNLWNNNIRSKGAEYVANAIIKNSSITNLNIISNNIKTDGARSIANAIMQNASITNLDINSSDEDIGEKGKKEIIGAILNNSTLLSVFGDEIRDDSKVIDKLKRNLNNTILSANNGNADAMWRLTEHYARNLEEEVGYVSKASNAMWRIAGYYVKSYSTKAEVLSSLIQAADSGNILALKAAAELYKNGACRISGNSIEADKNPEKAAVYQAKYMELKKEADKNKTQSKEIAISANKNEKAADSEINKSNLNEELITAAQVGDLEAVSKLLGQGTEIDYLGRAENKSAIYYAFINGHREIVELLEKKGANIEINISEEVKNKIEEAEKNNEKKLEISYLNSVEISELALALKSNQSITSLNLGGNEIGDEGASRLADALMKNQSITSLFLDSNNIGSEGASRLSDALIKNQSITSLFLASNNIGDEGASRLADALIKNQSITSLYLVGNEIGSEGASRLSDALIKNQSITTLFLTSNNIGDEGASRLADALIKNQSITELTLSQNNIGDEGASRLADALIKNQFITTLFLGSNNIGDEGASRLADALMKNQSITSLFLDSNNIGSEGASRLLEGLRSKYCRVSDLDLGENNISEDLLSKINAQLEINKGEEKSDEFVPKSVGGVSGTAAEESAVLDNLTLNEELVTAAQLGDMEVVSQLLDQGAEIDYLGGEENKSAIYYAFINGHREIVELLEKKGANIEINISKKVRDVIEKAEKNSEKKLEISYLNSVEISELALALKSNQSITKLDLSWNNIGDEGASILAEALKINQSITELRLWKNNIGAEGASRIADSLKINKSITELDLSANNIGAEGSSRISETLKINQSITKLYLGGNRIGDEGALRIADALKINQSITELYLYSNNIGYEGASRIADVLKINQSITELKLWNNNIGYEVALRIADALKINQSITELSLSMNNIGSEGALKLLEALQSKYCRVSDLDLDKNNISEDLLSKIKAQLEINKGKEKSDEFVPNLAGDVSGAAAEESAVLDNLTLNEELVTAAQLGDMEVVSQLLDQGADIDYLGGEENKSAIYYAFINGYMELVDELLKRGADVSVSLSEKAKARLNNSNDSTIRGFGFNEIIELMFGLMKSSSMTDFNLKNNNIGVKGAEYLANAMMQNSSIISLDLQNNNIGDEGAKYIANAMMKNSSIAYLDFGRNNIGDIGARSLANAIMKSSSITDLNLRNNNLKEKGAEYVANAIMQNSSITSLDLSFNNIMDVGAEYIANAIMENSFITDLNLRSNKIGAKGARSIANAVMKNSSITDLNLYSNNLGDDGARSIANAIMQNSSITTLYIWDNNIGAKGKDDLIKAILTNSTLFYVYGHDIEKDSKVIDKLKSNINNAIKAAKNGNSDVMWRLGEYYARNGKKAEAVNYLTNAADSGNIFAVKAAAELYKNGVCRIARRSIQVDKNPEKSAVYQSRYEELRKELEKNKVLAKGINIPVNQNDKAADSEINKSDLNEELITAAQIGDLEEVSKLLDQGAEIDYLGGEENKSAIYYAFINGHREIVELLEKKGANIEINISEEVKNEIEEAEKNSEKNLVIRNFSPAEISELVLSLKSNKSIKVLDLSDNEIGDEGASRLAESLKNNQSITVLRLWNNNIGDEGALRLAESLMTNQSITRLDLASNIIGDEGSSRLAESLKNNQSITRLDLQNNNIGDEGASRLAESLMTNQSITRLDLASNNIGDEGSSRLAESLMTNQSITVLNISDNEIWDEGASRLAESLKNNQSITVLRLWNNNIGDEGASKLLEALQNKYCRVSALGLGLGLGLNNISEDLLSKIKAQLEINKGKEKSDEFVPKSARGVSGAAAEESAVLDNLTLNEELVTAAQLGDMEVVSQLLDQGAEIDYLGGEENKSAIYYAFINGYMELVDELLKRGADVSVSISEKVKNNLTKSQDIKIHDLSFAEIMELMLGIMRNSFVTSLNFGSNDIGDDGARSLANVIMENGSVTFLDLSWNMIGDKGVEYLANAIVKNSSITTLDFGFNNIGDKGAEYLANAIMENDSIISLNLVGNNIGAKGVECLAKAMMKNSSIISFDLGGNDITDKGAKYLADAIMKNRSVTSLFLFDSKIGGKAKEDIVKAILNNPTLLYVEGHDIEKDSRVIDKLKSNLNDTIKAAKNGNADAMWRLSEYYARSGKKAEAVNYLTNAADSENIFAAKAAAELYKNEIFRIGGKLFQSTPNLAKASHYLAKYEDLKNNPEIQEVTIPVDQNDKAADSEVNKSDLNDEFRFGAFIEEFIGLRDQETEVNKDKLQSQDLQLEEESVESDIEKDKKASDIKEETSPIVTRPEILKDEDERVADDLNVKLSEIEQKLLLEKARLENEYKDRIAALEALVERSKEQEAELKRLKQEAQEQLDKVELEHKEALDKISNELDGVKAKAQLEAEQMAAKYQEMQEKFKNDLSEVNKANLAALELQRKQNEKFQEQLANMQSNIDVLEDNYNKYEGSLEIIQEIDIKALASEVDKIADRLKLADSERESLNLFAKAFEEKYHVISDIEDKEEILAARLEELKKQLSKQDLGEDKIKILKAEAEKIEKIQGEFSQIEADEDLQEYYIVLRRNLTNGITALRAFASGMSEANISLNMGDYVGKNFLTGVKELGANIPGLKVITDIVSYSAKAAIRMGQIHLAEQLTRVAFSEDVIDGVARLVTIRKAQKISQKEVLEAALEEAGLLTSFELAEELVSYIKAGDKESLSAVNYDDEFKSRMKLLQKKLGVKEFSLLQNPQNIDALQEKKEFIKLSEIVENIALGKLSSLDRKVRNNIKHLTDESKMSRYFDNVVDIMLGGDSVAQLALTQGKSIIKKALKGEFKDLDKLHDEELVKAIVDILAPEIVALGSVSSVSSKDQQPTTEIRSVAVDSPLPRSADGLRPSMLSEIAKLGTRRQAAEEVFSEQGANDSEIHGNVMVKQRGNDESKIVTEEQKSALRAHKLGIGQRALEMQTRKRAIIDLVDQVDAGLKEQYGKKEVKIQTYFQNLFKLEMMAAFGKVWMNIEKQKSEGEDYKKIYGVELDKILDSREIIRIRDYFNHHYVRSKGYVDNKHINDSIEAEAKYLSSLYKEQLVNLDVLNLQALSQVMVCRVLSNIAKGDKEIEGIREMAELGSDEILRNRLLKNEEIPAESLKMINLLDSTGVKLEDGSIYLRGDSRQISEYGIRKIGKEDFDIFKLKRLNLSYVRKEAAFSLLEDDAEEERLSEKTATNPAPSRRGTRGSFGANMGNEIQRQIAEAKRQWEAEQAEENAKKEAEMQKRLAEMAEQQRIMQEQLSTLSSGSSPRENKNNNVANDDSEDLSFVANEGQRKNAPKPGGCCVVS